ESGSIPPRRHAGRPIGRTAPLFRAVRASRHSKRQPSGCLLCFIMRLFGAIAPCWLSRTSVSNSPYASRATPARLTAPAAAKLSRSMLIGLCLVYIVFGLFLRDPWKTDDVVGLAQMWTAVH